MNFKKHNFLFVILLLVTLIGIFLFIRLKNTPVVVSSFDECVASGSQVLESYPAQCRTQDGKVFTQDIGNELEMQDMIVVENPRPNQEIESPLQIKGRARGNYFFEGSFPVLLLDESGKTISKGFATAEGEWMTEDFVAFSGELSFSPVGNKGKLILQRDNPSGLPENDAELVVPVTFSN